MIKRMGVDVFVHNIVNVRWEYDMRAYVCMNAVWYRTEIYLFCDWINKLSENNCSELFPDFTVLRWQFFFHSLLSIPLATHFPPVAMLLFFRFKFFVFVYRIHTFFFFLDNIFLDILQTSHWPFCRLWHGTNAIRFCTMSFWWHFVVFIMWRMSLSLCLSLCVCIRTFVYA